MKNKTGNDVALESINELLKLPDEVFIKKFESDNKIENFLPDEVINYLEEHRIYNQNVADLIMKYLEKNGEDELIKYITSLEDGLEAAIKRIEELEDDPEGN